MIGTGCILGRAPHPKETLPDFRETSTSIPRVDGLSTRHPDFEASQLLFVYG